MGGMYNPMMGGMGGMYNPMMDPMMGMGGMYNPMMDPMMGMGMGMGGMYNPMMDPMMGMYDQFGYQGEQTEEEQLPFRNVDYPVDYTLPCSDHCACEQNCKFN